MIKAFVLSAVFLVAGLGLLAGCGKAPDGPKRYELAGTVHYDGKPLESGRITFVPDSSAGNEGPAGYGLVSHGTFDTRMLGGKGAVSGPIQVLITGYPPQPPEGQEVRPPLFEDHVIKFEISPDQDHKNLHFDIELKPRKRGP
ncbi:MAG TPA: hypothetical protein VNQ76_00945 [Planctomicrobium sp.]|nr:hypothetical protein [Planctomicrobium sp.]